MEAMEIKLGFEDERTRIFIMEKEDSMRNLTLKFWIQKDRKVLYKRFQ